MMWDVRTVQQKATHSTAIVGKLLFSGPEVVMFVGGWCSRDSTKNMYTHTHACARARTHRGRQQ